MTGISLYPLSFFNAHPTANQNQALTQTMVRIPINYLTLSRGLLFVAGPIPPQLKLYLTLLDQKIIIMSHCCPDMIIWTLWPWELNTLQFKKNAKAQMCCNLWKHHHCIVLQVQTQLCAPYHPLFSPWIEAKINFEGEKVTNLLESYYHSECGMFVYLYVWSFH